MLFWKKNNKKLIVVDCINVASYLVENFPFYIGTSSDCDIRINNPNLPQVANVSFAIMGKHLIIKTPDSISKINYDSTPLSGSVIVAEGIIHTLQYENALFLFYYGENYSSISPQLNCEFWNISNANTNEIIYSNARFSDIHEILQEKLNSIEGIVISPVGSSVGFWANAIFDSFDMNHPRLEKENNVKSIISKYKNQQIDEEFGELICPSCWLRFNTEDVNYISVHADLMGDPLLGEDEHMRFLPTKYNTKGMPLDPMGVPAHEMACPHCHRRLPSSFLSMKDHIISLVGAPSAGKSYYLSILLHHLPNLLYKNFNIALVDADPTMNAAITAMKNRLFSLSNSTDHFLLKTQLEGGMYDKLIRHGKVVSLPKPFVYILRDMNDFSNQTSLTFYDNAGEHFEPGISIDDSPGALHVASADVLMYLYDPLVATNIRLNVDSNIDPQLNKDAIDQQSVILSEMVNRIKQIKNIENAYDLRIPFAFIVNKCDAIDSLFDISSLDDPMKNGTLDLDAIDTNSEKIKEFLLTYVPDVVINAEMISKNIKFFMVSSFGHSPNEIIKEDGSKYIAPDVKMIKPLYIEIPLLWAFTQIETTPFFSKIKSEKKKSSFIF